MNPLVTSQTFDFLNQLTENNNREWFHEHKTLFQQSQNEVIRLADGLLKQIRVFDHTIPKDLEGKKTVFRIYRDTRFSKEKTPYKTNFGIGISAPGYYLHIEPNKSFVAGGYWNPNPEHLSAIRQEIDYNGNDFLEIVKNAKFVDYFTNLDTEAKLKKAPKGYDESNPMIDFLKLKMYIVYSPIPDTDLCSEQGLEKVVEKFKTIYPLNTFLRQAIS